MPYLILAVVVAEIVVVVANARPNRPFLAA